MTKKEQLKQVFKIILKKYIAIWNKEDEICLVELKG